MSDTKSIDRRATLLYYSFNSYFEKKTTYVRELDPEWVPGWDPARARPSAEQLVPESE